MALVLVISAIDGQPGQRPAGSGGRPSPLYGVQTTIATDGTACLTIRGELDVTNVAALSGELAKLAKARPARIVIDLSAVTFVDCASARLLATAATFLPAGCRPELRSAGPAVRRLLELTGLAGFFLAG